MASQSLRIEVVDDHMAEVLRSKTPAERLQIAHGMWAHASRMILRVLKSEHPEWSEKEIRVQVARRLSHGAI